MAAFDASGHPTATGTGASITWTHTPVAGSGFSILVLVICRKGASTVGDLPSSVTYGGSAMSLISSTTDATTFIRIAAYSMLSPATGAQTVLVSWGASQGASHAVSISATSTNSFGPLATAAGNSTTTSVTPVTTPTSSDLVVDIAGSDTGGSGFTTAGANQTQVMKDNTGLSDFTASTQPGSAGADPMTQTVTTGTWFCGCVVMLGGTTTYVAPKIYVSKEAQRRASRW